MATNLAYTCSVLKAGSMNDMIWKVEKLEWQAVAEEIRKEETTLTEERDRGLPISPTPYLDDVAKAAQGNWLRGRFGQIPNRCVRGQE